MTAYRYEKTARPDFVQMDGQRRKNPRQGNKRVTYENMERKKELRLHDY